MGDSVEEFLAKHRTSARWLDDIINVLLDEHDGTAHVREIAEKLLQFQQRDISTIEKTITRRINDYCSDATDFKKQPDCDLFQRVAGNTFRLRTFPHKPDIYDLMDIRFDEEMVQTMWLRWVWLCKSKDNEKWKLATNRQKLAAFVRWFEKPEQQKEYEGVKS